MSRMHEEIDGTRRHSLKTAALSIISAAELGTARSASAQPKMPSLQAVKPEAYFPGFVAESVGTNGTTIHVLRKGAGRPLLLLHGYPETHLTWHKVAPRLAEQFFVVVPDLRGYGESGKPQDGERHQNYSFRAMAQDQVEVMRHYGHERFLVAAHDRGARVAHRMCLDHPKSVEKVCLMDIAPTLTIDYGRWFIDHVFILAPAATYVGQWLQSFREFPPSQKPGAFNLNRVMEAVTNGAIIGNN